MRQYAYSRFTGRGGAFAKTAERLRLLRRPILQDSTPAAPRFLWRCPMNMTGLDKWYDYVKTHDRDTLWDLLDPDVVFESPVVHTPQHGRDITFKYLWSVGKVLGGPSFAFVREWRNANSAVLEFEAEIDGIKLNGVDIITCGDDGRVTHFKVMVRPLKAINLLHQLMGEQLMKQAGDAGVARS
jgi:hypothetical protein